MTLQEAIEQNHTENAVMEVDCILRICLAEQFSTIESTRELARDVIALIDCGIEKED